MLGVFIPPTCFDQSITPELGVPWSRQDLAPPKKTQKNPHTINQDLRSPVGSSHGSVGTKVVLSLSIIRPFPTATRPLELGASRPLRDLSTRMILPFHNDGTKSKTADPLHLGNLNFSSFKLGSNFQCNSHTRQMKHGILCPCHLVSPSD